MNKEKFTKWIEVKVDYLIEHMPKRFIDNKETKAFLQGCIKTMEEIKDQVESGKFD